MEGSLRGTVMGRVEAYLQQKLHTQEVLRELTHAPPQLPYEKLLKNRKQDNPTQHQSSEVPSSPPNAHEYQPDEGE